MRKNTEDTGRHTDLWVDSKGTMQFTPPFFGQHFTRVRSVACDQRSAWMGFLANQSVGWWEPVTEPLVLEIFSIKLSADVLFLRKVSLEAAISLWIFNWRLNMFFLSQAYWLYIDPSQGYFKIYYENASQWSCLVWLANKMQDQISRVSWFPQAECFEASDINMPNFRIYCLVVEIPHQGSPFRVGILDPWKTPPNLRPGGTQLSTLHAEATSCVGFGEGINAGEELVHGVKNLINLTYLTPKQTKYQFQVGGCRDFSW